MPGTDAALFYERLDELGVPYRTSAAASDVSPRMARDVVRAVRAERPDLLHTHLVHGDVYGSIAAVADATPVVSTRHNDDRYLLGPFRYVDRAFARPTRRLIAISDAVRAFLEAAGHDARKLDDHPLRPRRGAGGAVRGRHRRRPACPAASRSPSPSAA